MCRLYGFRANQLTKVECSLVHAQNALLGQSKADATGRQADGWGIACYGDMAIPENRIPQLVKHKTAAFEDASFGHEAESTYAQTVVAHVRLATVGAIGPLNSHPFTYDGWTFAHNGTISGFEILEPELAVESARLQACRLGTTDSEQLFLWLLSRLRTDGVQLRSPDLDRVCHSIEAAVTELDRRCRSIVPNETPRLTFLLTNGRAMIACRWHNPLHRLTRRGDHACGICGIPHIRHADTSEYVATIVASEPITEEAWEEVPEESAFAVSEDFEEIAIMAPQGAKS